MAEHPRGAVLRRAIETCIAPDDDAIAKLGELFTDDATVWSPNMLAVGLADLAENLVFREAAFSDVDIQIDSLDIFGSRGLAEFRVAATFSGPFVIDEAVVIEPNGQPAPARRGGRRRLRRRQDQGAPRLLRRRHPAGADARRP